MRNKIQNDLYYTCSLIEYIARKTKNTSKFIVNTLGIKYIEHIFQNAGVLHSENLDEVSDRYIEFCNVNFGNHLIESDFKVPSHWELGKVYMKLVYSLSDNNNYIEKLSEVYNSWIVDIIENYNAAFYFLPSNYMLDCYKYGRVLEY